MPSTTETTNLGLTIYQSEDKPTYLVDYNNDMQKIDTAYGGIKTAAESADAKATSAGNLAQAASDAVGTAVDKANCAMSAASSVAGTADSALTKAEGAVTLATSASQQAQAAAEKVNQVEAGLVNIDDISVDFNVEGITLKCCRVVNGFLILSIYCGSAISIPMGTYLGTLNYSTPGMLTAVTVLVKENSANSEVPVTCTLDSNGFLLYTAGKTSIIGTFPVLTLIAPWNPEWTKKPEPDEPPKPVVPPTPISPPGNASNMTLTGSALSASTVKMLNSPPTFTIWFDVTPTDEITAPFVCGTLSGWPGNVNPTTTISGTLSPGGSWSISTAGVLTINPDKAYGQGQHFTGTVSVASWYTPPVTVPFNYSYSNYNVSGSATRQNNAISISLTKTRIDGQTGISGGSYINVGLPCPDRPYNNPYMATVSSANNCTTPVKIYKETAGNHAGQWIVSATVTNELANAYSGVFTFSY